MDGHETMDEPMKLTTITRVSVDGVMQGLGGADEDRRRGFERAGWTVPVFDDEAATFLDQVYSAPTRSCSAIGHTRSLPAIGSNGRFGQFGRSGVERAAQARRIDHAHRPAMGRHDRPLR